MKKAFCRLPVKISNVGFRASFAGSERFALLEWQTILQNYTPEEIRKIITQDIDEGQRLRSSSPFAGVLDKVIRDKVWSEVITAKDTNYTKKDLHFYPVLRVFCGYVLFVTLSSLRLLFHCWRW
jgi:hypothetical protein